MPERWWVLIAQPAASLGLELDARAVSLSFEPRSGPVAVVAWSGHVDRRVRSVSETPGDGGGLAGQGRASAGSQDAGHPDSGNRNLRSADAEDAADDPEEKMASHAIVDRFARDAGIEELEPGNRPVLPPGQVQANLMESGGPCRHPLIVKRKSSHVARRVQRFRTPLGLVRPVQPNPSRRGPYLRGHPTQIRASSA